MNRISLAEQTKLAEQIKLIEDELRFDPEEILNQAETESPEHSLFVPMHYEQNYSYPLVIWLNESGASQRTFSRLMPQISMRNYVGISPAWENTRAGWQQDPQGILDAENTVADCIATACEKFNINESRIFIAGCNDGGTMAYRVALAHPDWFAGVLSFGGAMPQNLNPLADFKRCRKMSCFVSQMRDCSKFGTDILCDQLKLMYSAGFDVTVRQYPDEAQILPRVLNDMNGWMMELVSGARSSVIQTGASASISDNN